MRLHALALPVVLVTVLVGFALVFSNPASPAPFVSDEMATTVHHRNLSGDAGDSELPPAMNAQHGTDCGPPPGVHLIRERQDFVFECRAHLMTAIKGAPYGAVILTPAAMLDWCSGSATLRWRQSTSRGSARDWWDVWLSPFGRQFAVPVTQSTGTPDLQGPPPVGVAVVLDMFTDRITAEAHGVGGDYVEKVGPYFSTVAPLSSTTRELFELTVTPLSLTLSMPDYATTLLTATRANPLPYCQAMVQFGHHSYSPEKGCGNDPRFTPSVKTGGQMCGEGTTWHWSDFEVNPSVPLSLQNAQPTYVGGATGTYRLSWSQPALPGSVLEFSAIGTVELDFGDGRGFVPYDPLHADGDNWHAEMYVVPVPQGATGVDVRLGSGGPYGWMLHVKDAHLFARAASAGSPTPSPSPSPSATPSTSTPTPSPTPSPSPSPTAPPPTPTATATATPSPVPTASPTPTPSPTPPPSTCERVVRVNGVVMYVDAPLSECAGARP